MIEHSVPKGVTFHFLVKAVMPDKTTQVIMDRGDLEPGDMVQVNVNKSPCITATIDHTPVDVVLGKMWRLYDVSELEQAYNALGQLIQDLKQ